jgi:hypothetical protein
LQRLVAKFTEGERTAVGEGAGVLDRLGQSRETTLERFDPLEMTLRVRVKQVARLGDGRLVAYGGHDVLQDLASANVVKGSLRRERRDARPPGKRRQAIKLFCVVDAAMQLDEQPESVAEEFAIAQERRLIFR